jgi:thymidylate synthase
MKVVEARNVNDAYQYAVQSALDSRFTHDHKWRLANTRNGQAWRCTEPVVTQIAKPTERVLFNKVRDANPFFHLMEALWILAGHDDVEFISHFNSRIAQYSDDGKSFHGAYGYRLRGRIDQVRMAINHLIDNEDSRRVVLGIWDPLSDFNAAWKDIPCNTHIYLQARLGKLNMTICNRSNDVIWGAYGANIVHFSVLQEYIAACVDLGVGTYYHFSNDFHIYRDNPAWVRHEEHRRVSPSNTYRGPRQGHKLRTIPLVMEPVLFDDELFMFFQDDWEGFSYTEPFFKDVAVPMRQAWNIYKLDPNRKRWKEVSNIIRNILAEDWYIAAWQWMERRYNDYT